MATTRVIFTCLLCYVTFTCVVPIPIKRAAQTPGVVPGYTCSVHIHPECANISTTSIFKIGLCLLLQNETLKYCLKTGKALPPSPISKTIGEICSANEAQKKIPTNWDVIEKSDLVALNLLSKSSTCVENCTPYKNLCLYWENLSTAIRDLSKSPKESAPPIPSTTSIDSPKKMGQQMLVNQEKTTLGIGSASTTGETDSATPLKTESNKTPVPVATGMNPAKSSNDGSKLISPNSNGGETKGTVASGNRSIAAKSPGSGPLTSDQEKKSAGHTLSLSANEEKMGIPKVSGMNSQVNSPTGQKSEPFGQVGTSIPPNDSGSVNKKELSKTFVSAEEKHEMVNTVSSGTNGGSNGFSGPIPQGPIDKETVSVGSKVGGSANQNAPSNAGEPQKNLITTNNSMTSLLRKPIQSIPSQDPNKGMVNTVGLANQNKPTKTLSNAGQQQKIPVSAGSDLNGGVGGPNGQGPFGQPKKDLPLNTGISVTQNVPGKPVLTHEEKEKTFIPANSSINANLNNPNSQIPSEPNSKTVNNIPPNAGEAVNSDMTKKPILSPVEKQKPFIAAGGNVNGQPKYPIQNPLETQKPIIPAGGNVNGQSYNPNYPIPRQPIGNGMNSFQPNLGGSVNQNIPDKTFVNPLDTQKPVIPSYGNTNIGRNEPNYQNPIQSIGNRINSHQPNIDSSVNRNNPWNNRISEGINIDPQNNNNYYPNAGQQDFEDRARNTKQDKNLLKAEYNETPSSAHFMGYFLTAIVLCIAGYVVFHNKQKIIAFIIEGRNQKRNRRPNSGEYKKLSTNVDDVMSSLEKTTTSKNYIY